MLLIIAGMLLGLLAMAIIDMSRYSDDSDYVPVPWTPVRTDTDGDSLRVSVWGREYIYSNGLLPGKIITVGEDILSGPIRLIAANDSGPIVWDKAQHFVASRSKSSVVVCGSQNSEDVIANAIYTVDYDGAIRIDMSIFPHREGTSTLNKLWVEIPIKSSKAFLYHYWPKDDTGVVQQGSSANSGALPADGLQLPFKPCVWLGWDEGGISWYADSDEFWTPADQERAIEIIRNENETILRLHLADSHPEFWGRRTDSWGSALKPLNITFGLQATPVKEFPKDRHRLKLWVGPSSADAYTQPDEKINGMTGFEYVTANGIKTIHIHEDWSNIQSYCMPADSEGLDTLIRGARQRDARVISYFGYELSTLSPDWAKYGDSCVIKGTDEAYLGGWERKPPQRAYMVCYASEWQDKLLEQIRKAMEEHSTDGVYLDGTTMPWGCCNEAHGCGYRDKSGALHPTYPVFAVRNLMRRMYEYVQSKGGIVNAHQSGCCTTPTLGFVHSYWDGENLQSTIVDDPLATLPLEAFRAEFVGRNFGIPGDFLIYPTPPHWTYSKALAITMLNDVLPRPAGFGGDNEFVFKMWKTLDKFGYANADWYPYWGDMQAVICTPEQIKCSAYVNRQTSELLLIIANLSQSVLEARVDINTEGLGINKVFSSVKEKLTGKPVAIDNNIVTATLGTLEAAVVRVR